ncbi:MAG: hypothetical protein AAF490_09070 [Chloroflexota bacterium]
MPELNRLMMTRVVATKEALDTAVFPQNHQTIRIAPDEVLIHPPVADISVDDPYAIIVSDGSFAGVWLSDAESRTLLSHNCEWEPPEKRPSFAQGAVGGIATKIIFEEEQSLFIVPAAMAAEFEERLP